MKFNTKEERDKFILDNLKLVDYMINKQIQYDLFDYSYEDIQQIGYVGLIKAVDKYDENRGIKFSSYASFYIVGEIMMSFREVHKGIRYGRKILINKDKISQKIEHESIEQIAKELNLTKQEVNEINLIEITPYSLNYKVRNKEGKIIGEYIDFLVDKEINNSKILNKLFEKISSRDKYILTKFFEGYTQTEISKKVEISQVQVGRIIKKSLCRLREVA